MSNDLLSVSGQTLLDTVVTFLPFVIPMIICYFIAKRKGLSRYFCLFGFLSLIGVIIVALIRPNTNDISQPRNNRALRR